jgi:hypothetical protein
MSDTPDPREKRKRDIAHKELREMVENAIMFVGLSLLLSWASDHVHNLAAGVRTFEILKSLSAFPP